MYIRNMLLFSCVAASLVFFDFGKADSLFDEANYQSLVRDHRAYVAGDSLTILIYEQASASSSADTDTSKEMDIGGRVRGNYSDYGGSAGFSSNFSGGGEVSRSGNLIASISVIVTEVLENGEMKVAGEQLIKLNDEQQRIEVSGRVRPVDISVDNTVPSTRLADAQIDYIGDGLLGSRQKPGIITRVFNWLF